MTKRLAGLFLWLITAPLGAANHTVTLSGITFSPADLTIQVGDQVTWTNDDGFHNVEADDGLFGSGAPASSPWTYSFTFHEGDVHTYRCDVHVSLGMVGSVTVDGIFGDGFESGDLAAWDTSTGGP